MEQAKPARTLLIDGATGTELARRGADLTPPLWSAHAIEQAPETLRAIHEAHLRAGAEAVTACTFRTHTRTLLAAGRNARAARTLTRDAVRLAREAVEAARPGAIVLGSVAPLEDCYEPQRAPDETTCRREHALQIESLLGAGADVILIETMNCSRESVAASIEAAPRAPGRWALSMMPAPSDGPGAHLSAEPIARTLDRVDAEAEGGLASAWAIGVNCGAAPDLAREVAFLRARLPDTLPVMAYANVGRRSPDGTWTQTDAANPRRYASYAMEWLDAGASVIGGCCGAAPETIAAVRSRLDAREMR